MDTILTRGPSQGGNSKRAEFHRFWAHSVEISPQQRYRRQTRNERSCADKLRALERLIAIAGRPLSNAQEHDESERILKLARNPVEQVRTKPTQRQSANQCLFANDSQSFSLRVRGQKLRVDQSDLQTQSSVYDLFGEGKILKKMRGEIWIHANQKHLVSISGQLMNEVKFAGGFNRSLEKGGQFSVKRAEIVPGDWELTELAVSMRVKAVR